MDSHANIDGSSSSKDNASIWQISLVEGQL